MILENGVEDRNGEQVICPFCGLQIPAPKLKSANRARQPSAFQFCAVPYVEQEAPYRFSKQDRANQSKRASSKQIEKTEELRAVRSRFPGVVSARTLTLDSFRGVNASLRDRCSLA
jgi:hypothetical protein